MLKQIILLLAWPVLSFAGSASDITLSGRVTDWDENRVFLKSYGVEFSVPRSTVPKDVKLDAGKKLVVQVDSKKFEKSVAKRIQPIRTMGSGSSHQEND